MTIKGFMKKLTGKLTLLLAIVALLSFSMFFFSACGKDNKSSTTEKEYTRSTENTSPISNMNFVYGTDDLALTKYPFATSTWNRALDNGAKTSQVNSGVIDISEEGWDKLIRTLYDDSDFLYFANSKYTGGYAETSTAKKTAIDTYNQTAPEDKKIEYTDDNLNDAYKEFVVRTFDGIGIKKPATHDGMEDTKVYMLNNYMSKSSEELGFGTAQTISSASTVTLEKGKYAEISVWVMTQNISGQNKDGKYGANVRLNNSIKGVSQAQYRISNIDTNGEWEKFSIYVKADATYDTTFSLALGLGYGSGSAAAGVLYTEGTVYFDDISYNVLTQDEFDLAIGTKTRNTCYLNFGETEALDVDARALGDEVLIYKLEMSNSLNGILVNIEEGDLTVTENFTEAEGNFNPAITSKTMFGERSSAEEKEGISVSLNNAAYTFEINNSDFTLENGKYAFITFDVLNNLSKFGASDIYVSIIDEYNGITEKREALTTVSEISENVKTVGLLLKNNFVSGDNRSFKIIVEIGPKDCDVLATTDITKYASGTVTLSNFKIAVGTIDDEEDKLYSFFTSIADATQALYAGFTSDYTEETETKSYDLSPASGNIGEIVNYPTNLQNYKGIVAENHNFITEDGTDLSVNTRSGKGDGSGSFAGLINTAYLEAYKNNIGLNIANVIGDYEEDFQPLMIYNNTEDHYGFIGNNNTVISSSYAKVSVTLSVAEGATAYIYLVDTYGKNKNVMFFDDFTSNGNLIKGEDLNFALSIGSEELDENGWVTVNFYIATGKTEKQFRLEIWNGGRDNANETASSGYVFVKNISISTSGAFTEAERFADTFNNTTTPLGAATKDAFNNGELYLYKYGEEFNEQSYIWAKNDTMVYAVYNTIDKVEETETEEESKTSDKKGCASGCKANTDPSTFWLSFSSILLAVVLVLAIIALFIKNIRRGKKHGKSDAKSHYAINSRAKALKTVKEKEAKAKAEAEAESETTETVEQPSTEPVSEETSEEPTEEATENNEEVQEENKETLDEYVYGEVTDFGETETNTETSSENAETETTETETVEQPSTEPASEETATEEVKAEEPSEDKKDGE